jgi:hypothetical protein
MTILETPHASTIVSNYAGVILGCLNFLALVVGGIFAYRRFILQREEHPKIAFDLEVAFLARQNNQILVEVSPVLTNVGLVRHSIDPETFTISLRYLTATDLLQEGGVELNHQIQFPHSAKVHTKGDKDNTHASTTKRMLVPADWGDTFVDPGVTQRYSYVMAVPSDAVCLLVRARFDYLDLESAFHGAQRAFKVPVEI